MPIPPIALTLLIAFNLLIPVSLILGVIGFFTARTNRKRIEKLEITLRHVTDELRSKTIVSKPIQAQADAPAPATPSSPASFKSLEETMTEKLQQPSPVNPPPYVSDPTQGACSGGVRDG